jgi:hypothetical protein
LQVRAVLGVHDTLLDVYERGVRPFLTPPNRLAPLPALPRRLHDFQNIYSVTLECRLGPDGGPVDFAWNQHREDFEIPESVGRGEPWDSMDRFRQHWLLHEKTLPAVPSIVCEVDQDGDNFGDVPAVFFNRVKGDASSVAAIYRLTNSLLSRPVSPATETMLRRVVDSMPPESIVLCIGYMLSRPDAPVRFELTEMDPKRSLPAYLRAIGWPGDIGRVADTIEALPNLARAFDLGLAFDVSDVVGPRLGLEFVFRNRTDHDAALADALDDLISAGLCTPGWRETFARWTGKAQALPDWYRAFVADPSGHHRFVSHFKIVLDGPQIEAKGYVECIPLSMLAPTRARHLACAAA